jgi:hypothetical protein
MEHAVPRPATPFLAADACARRSEQADLVACMREQRWELLD